MNKKYIIMITALPAVILLSVIFSMLFFIKKPVETSTPLTSEVTAVDVQLTLDKLYNYIGKRDIETDQGRKNLRSVVAMVDGSLGPENIGYIVQHSEGEVRHGLIWPMLWLDLGAEKTGKVKVLAVAQDDEGVALAFAMHFAEYVAGSWDGERVKIVFYPPMMDGPDQEKVWKTLGISENDHGDFVSVTSEAGGEGIPRVTADQVRINLFKERASFEQAEVIMGLLPRVLKLLK